MRNYFGRVIFFTCVSLTLLGAVFFVAACGIHPSQSAVSNPTPTIQAISPAVVAIGSNAQITITGTGFLSSSIVTVNGASRSANFANSDQLNLPLSGTDLSTVGNVSIVVTNPSPGGGSSTPANFSVWNSLTNTTAGFSLLYPPSVYGVGNSSSPSVDFASSPNGVAIGGAVPDFGAPSEASSGFDINIYYQPYTVSGIFDVNGYISTIYPGRIIGTLTPVTVGGQQGSALTFQQEEGGGHPDVVVYHNGYVYEISYSSTINVAGFSDTVGLGVFNQMLQNFTFTR